MTARERLHKCIAGEDLDRPLVSAWRHFYNMETTSSGLAEAMVSFQKRFEWDFMKINPRASYHMEDWGNELEWSTDEFRKHTKVRFAVEEIDDWEKITVLKPTSPVLAETLEAIRLIRMGVGPDLPLLMTVFTPLSIAGDLVRSDQILLDHLTRDKPRVVAALERITETFESYVPELRKAGADGLFYATTQWASCSLMAYDEYRSLGRGYDLPVLKAAGDDAVNLLHVCASENFLKELADYPVQLVNWDESDPTNLNLAEGIKALGSKMAVGGLDHNGWLKDATPQEVEFKVRKLFHEHQGERFIFAPGCSMPPETPMENLEALANTVKELRY